MSSRCLAPDWVAVVKEAVDDAEERYLKSTLPTSLEDLAPATLEHSHLHAMGQLGDMLEEQGVDVLRDKAAGDTDGQYIVVNNAVLDYPAVQRLALESPLGNLAAQLFGSKKVNFLFDQIFIKQPGAGTRTAFHQDWGYFHVDGEQVASFWTAAESVAKKRLAWGTYAAHTFGTYTHLTLLFPRWQWAMKNFLSCRISKVTRMNTTSCTLMSSLAT